MGDCQKTRSTVGYKIPLVDTGGRTVEVAAYGMNHIMAPLETVDPTLMRAVFPEAPTGGLEAASGRIDLLMGQDNLRLFPVEHRRVEEAALHRSRFGTGWIASGRPPGPGVLATSARIATSAGMRTSKEAAAAKGKPAHTITMDKQEVGEKEKRQSSLWNQLGVKQADRAIRAGLIAGPSRVVPPLHKSARFSSLLTSCQPKRLVRTCRADANHA
jgi:hypothetical protein